ncbi:MAG: hypothetical protein K2J71_06295 [Oscillospiraceae bacterium]|nr:hypothetical protein [Oscillospiraceae bacterium]
MKDFENRSAPVGFLRLFSVKSGKKQTETQDFFEFFTKKSLLFQEKLMLNIENCFFPLTNLSRSSIIKNSERKFFAVYAQEVRLLQATEER